LALRPFQQARPAWPQQRLLGQAANGDVVTVDLAKDYQALLAAEEDVQMATVNPALL
jgi:hypothetical protein